MSDLPHTYTSDINFPEAQVDAADTQFLAQRLGRNTNYLLDRAPALQAELNAIAPVFFDPVDFSGSYSTGDHILATESYLIYNAILFVTPGFTAPRIAGGGFGGVLGPPIPIVIQQSVTSLQRNWVYGGSGGSGDFAFDIFNSPAFDELVFHTNGGGAYTITGWLIHS